MEAISFRILFSLPRYILTDSFSALIIFRIIEDNKRNKIYLLLLWFTMSRISVTNSSSTKAIFSTSSIFSPTSTCLAQYHLTVTSLCRGHYLRNNKRGGLKNMRCFPECLQAGHHSKGFCGHRVTAVCNSERPLPNGTILVGSFVTWDDKRNITDDVSFKIGD